MNDKLIEKVKEFKIEYDEIRKREKALEENIKIFGKEVIKAIELNGWAPPSKPWTFSNTWSALERGKLDNYECERVLEFLTTTPDLDWKGQLGINFEICETRVFLDDYFVGKKHPDEDYYSGHFCSYGGYAQKGFYSSWGSNESDISRNHQFLKKVGKNRVVYMILERPFISSKVSQEDFAKAHHLVSSRGYIQLTPDLIMAGCLVGINTKTGKVVVYDGRHHYEKKFPGKTNELIDYLNHQTNKYHDEIKENAALHLTSTDEYTRKYSEFACSDELFKVEG